MSKPASGQDILSALRRRGQPWDWKELGTFLSTIGNPDDGQYSLENYERSRQAINEQVLEIFNSGKLSNEQEACLTLDDTRPFLGLTRSTVPCSMLIL